jgi:hypothetical protein
LVSARSSRPGAFILGLDALRNGTSGAIDDVETGGDSGARLGGNIRGGDGGRR